MELRTLSLDLILEAAEFLRNQIIYTPIEYSPGLSEILEVPTYLKLESLQITGSFKIRGALFYVSSLAPHQKENGIAACSAGNHGLGVAYAANKMGIRCTVYLPRNVDPVKKEKIRKLGAEIKESAFVGYDETLDWAKTEAAKNNQHLISAFEDERIMAANGGTIGAEIVEQVEDVQNVLFPVGGGGLGSGISYYLKEKYPAIRLIGCQHIDSPGLHLSLQSGKAMTTLPSIETVAGGLEGGIGARCFDVLKDRITEVSLATETEIIQACRWMLGNHQHLIEPSAVVPVACCLHKKVPKLKGKTVLVLTGRNIAFSTLQTII